MTDNVKKIITLISLLGTIFLVALIAFGLSLLLRIADGKGNIVMIYYAR